MGTASVEIEVSVQDYFYSNSQSAGEESEESATDSPISAQTWQSWFDSWIEILQPDMPVVSACELSLRLTDDAEIQTLNDQYRHQNKPTDVLAFAALEVECPQAAEAIEEQPLYLGDIVISVDTASRQAQQQRHSLKTELAWLAAHGLLHLLGWDHPDEDSLTQMLNKQATLLQKIGLTTEDGRDVQS